jgi:hypothetical protein
MGAVVSLFPHKEAEVDALTDLLLAMSEDSELALVHKDADGRITIQHWGDTTTPASRLRLFAEVTARMAIENEITNGH